VSVAVEVRNKTWMTPALASCLRRHNAVWVLPDQVWMPSPLSLVQRADLDVVTGAFAYIRLLGDREAVDALTPTLDHFVIDRGPEVEADARASQVLRQRVPVVAFVNKHYAGRARDGEATRGIDGARVSGARPPLRASRIVGVRAPFDPAWASRKVP